MKHLFHGNCRSLLIGSLPVSDHRVASDLVFRYTPQIPLWVQLPVYKEEGMMVQFLQGFPGLSQRNGKTFIDTGKDSYDEELLHFYESYMELIRDGSEKNYGSFALSEESAKGFFVFHDKISSMSKLPVALKMQITGPFTQSTGIKDQNARAIFFDDTLRDVSIKLLTLKAKWQIEYLKRFNLPLIVFMDEPALAGFGSSEFISISKDEVLLCLKEIVDMIHAEGAISAVHVCANTDWSLLLNSGVDIVNFDAYSYFEKFALYSKEIKSFVESGGMIAWGIIPTLRSEDIEKEDAKSIVENLKTKLFRCESFGIDGELLLRNSLITPSCGLGSLKEWHAEKVLKLTSDVSEMMQKAGGYTFGG